MNFILPPTDPSAASNYVRWADIPTECSADLMLPGVRSRGIPTFEGTLSTQVSISDQYGNAMAQVNCADKRATIDWLQIEDARIKAETNKLDLSNGMILLLLQAREDGMEAGYTQGYAEGYDEGRESGLDDGFHNGYDAGHESGWSAAQEASQG